MPKDLCNDFIKPYKFDDDYVAPIKYGLGVSMEEVGGYYTIGHPGQIKGFHSDILRLPHEEINVIFLSNINGYHFSIKWRFTDKLIKALYGSVEGDQE